MGDYKTQFMERVRWLQANTQLTSEEAIQQARKDLGPDPDQPNLDNFLKTKLVRVGFNMLILSKLKTWLPVIGSLAWGAVFVLKALGKFTQAAAIESILQTLQVSPDIVPIDYGGLITGAGGVYKLFKKAKEIYNAPAS